MSGPLRTTAAKPARQSIGKDQNLCEYCNAKCCRYFALPIDTPETYKEFDFVRWYLLHEHATVFVEDKVWYLLVHTKCKYLNEDNRCQIYDKRPQICREYSTKRCEYEDGYVYEQYFETPDQVEEYAQAVLGPRPESLLSDISSAENKELSCGDKSSSPETYSSKRDTK